MIRTPTPGTDYDCSQISVLASDSENESKLVVDVSVVIVNFNTKTVTKCAVASLLEFSSDLNVEIIVVDNNSSDGSPEELSRMFPTISVVATGQNGGYAWGNNNGIARAKGRYILVLNPDVLVHRETLKRAIDYLDCNLDVGILGAQAFFEDGSMQSSIFRHLSLSQLAWNIVIPNRIARNSRHFGDRRYASKTSGTVLDVEVVSGCFMLVPRRVIETVGPMNDQFFMYSEESEWCWRVRNAGFFIHHHPDVVITHSGGVTTGQLSSWKVVEIAKSQILFLRLTRGPVVARVGIMLMLLADLLRGIGLLTRLMTKGGRQDFQIWRARAKFLLKAVLRPPAGQMAPKINAFEA